MAAVSHAVACSYADAEQFRQNCSEECTTVQLEASGSAGAADVFHKICEPVALHTNEQGAQREYRLICDGIAAETILISGNVAFRSEYCGGQHLLIAHERLTRRRGYTSIDGLPTSYRACLTHSLTFVPAGYRFRDQHLPDMPSSILYLYLDPTAPSFAGRAAGGKNFAPRLHYHDPHLWQTVVKIRSLLEQTEELAADYRAALGLILAHEIARTDAVVRPVGLPSGSGLAAWQRQRLSEYFEGRLAEPITVATLAGLVRLSRFHFCRAFKQSFGLPPHRYHSLRRVERAKHLLLQSNLSITQIGLEVGFGESSSFSVAFRRITGNTPRHYRRSAAAA